MPEPQIPADFGKRLRMARAYCGDNGVERGDFAEMLSRPGLSDSNLALWEQGKRLPPARSAASYLERISEVSGLPQQFFLGEWPAERQAEPQHEEDVRSAIFALTTRELERAREAQQRHEEVMTAIRRLQPPPPQ